MENEAIIGIINYVGIFIILLLSFAISVKIFGAKNIFKSQIRKIISDPIILHRIIKRIDLLPYLNDNVLFMVKSQLSEEEYSELEKINSKSRSKYFISIILLFASLFMVFQFRNMLLELLI